MVLLTCSVLNFQGDCLTAALIKSTSELCGEHPALLKD